LELYLSLLPSLVLRYSVPPCFPSHCCETGVRACDALLVPFFVSSTSEMEVVLLVFFSWTSRVRVSRTCIAKNPCLGSFSGGFLLRGCSCLKHCRTLRTPVLIPPSNRWAPTGSFGAKLVPLSSPPTLFYYSYKFLFAIPLFFGEDGFSFKVRASCHLLISPFPSPRAFSGPVFLTRCPLSPGFFPS